MLKYPTTSYWVAKTKEHDDWHLSILSFLKLLTQVLSHVLWVIIYEYLGNLESFEKFLIIGVLLLYQCLVKDSWESDSLEITCERSFDCGFGLDNPLKQNALFLTNALIEESYLDTSFHPGRVKSEYSEWINSCH